MSQTLGEAELRERARKRVEALVGFYVHALVYVAVNSGLWIADLATGGGLDWAYWTTIPWGIGLIVHGVLTFAEVRWFAAGWRDRKIAEYMERERRESARSPEDQDRP